jgi:hypothetical protein
LLAPDSSDEDEEDFAEQAAPVGDDLAGIPAAPAARAQIGGGGSDDDDDDEFGGSDSSDEERDARGGGHVDGGDSGSDDEFGGTAAHEESIAAVAARKAAERSARAQAGDAVAQEDKDMFAGDSSDEDEYLVPETKKPAELSIKDQLAQNLQQRLGMSSCNISRVYSLFARHQYSTRRRVCFALL